MLGIRIIESDALPIAPSFPEQIRRRVRHELAARCPAALRTLDVGPRPEDETHAIIMGDTVHASAAVVGRMGREATCDHPGIEHGRWSYTWVCPGCGVCKFIGHGPLCGDCLAKGA